MTDVKLIGNRECFKGVHTIMRGGALLSIANLYANLESIK